MIRWPVVVEMAIVKGWPLTIHRPRKCIVARICGGWAFRRIAPVVEINCSRLAPGNDGKIWNSPSHIWTRILG
jgi:hypothetical protein